MISSSSSNEKWKNHTFQKPTKKIISLEDVEKFKKSNIFKSYMTYICELQQSVLSKPISKTKENEKFQKLVDYLTNLDTLIDEVPPLQQPMRFGNLAFKTWHEKMTKISEEMLDNILPKDLSSAKIELITYLMDSYGSYDRIDYGTGHELAFMIFLYCLAELGLYTKEDYESILRTVFYKYIKLMRKLQLTYMLEPAGSHGVWGMDDYQFLPFLFGAAELIDNTDANTPNCIHNDLLLNKLADEYIYLNIKKGPFFETSPILDDISATNSWNKVSQGMVKMYQGEVLFKHPVIKHAFFGTIFPFE